MTRVSPLRGLPALRVLRIITRLNVGGPARHVEVLARDLGRHGIDQVVAHGDPAPGEDEVLEGVRATGVPLVRVAGLGRAPSPLHDAAALARLIGLCRSVRPHLVHTHLAKAGALGRVAARLAGVPAVVHTFHGHVLEGYFGALGNLAVRAAERGLAALTDRIVAISPRQRADLVHRFRVAPRERVRVIPLGLDLDRFARAALEPLRGGLRAELGLSAEALLVGAVGRLVPIKRPLLLVEAFARLLPRAPGAHLVLAGQGPLRAEVEEAARRLGVAERVHLLGNRPDIERVFADLDVYALSSRNEGTPVALIEALAAGVAAVATDVGGVADITGAGEAAAALRIPHDAVDALAGALQRLVDDAALRGRLAARGPAAAARFGASALAEQVAALYRELRGPR